MAYLHLKFNKIMIKSFPKTCEDLLQLDTKDLSFSASWHDYLLLQGSTEFRMEFDDNIIYPKFCFESDNHSTIASLSLIHI